MQYRIQEGALSLDGRWQDQTVNVLLPLDAPTKGANLVVARDVLPLGMTLPDYVEQQQQTFRRDLPGYDVIQETAGVIDQRPAHFLEFTWRSDGKPLHQMMTVLQGEAGLLNFTASIPGEADAATRQALLDAVRTFRFAEPAGIDAPSDPARG